MPPHSAAIIPFEKMSSMYRVKVSANAPDSKVSQIANSMLKDIEAGTLEKGKRLPSINEFSEENKVARDTIEKAYHLLKKRGYVVSYPGRGYFVLGTSRKRKKVLLIFNKLSSFKKIIYESLLSSLGNKAKVDLQVHHYNPKLLKDILEENKGKYDFYAVMPHFFSDAREEVYAEIIRTVPAHQLVLLDKSLPQINYPHRAVYQDFQDDIYQALCKSSALFKKYRSITLILPDDIHHPKEINKGIENFCELQKLKLYHAGNVGGEAVRRGSVYIVTDEDNLAKLLMKVKKANLKLGEDIGIISFNETLYKELLDITVITTDFEEMGRTAAKLILGKECLQHKNPFRVIYRRSL